MIKVNKFQIGTLIKNIETCFSNDRVRWEKEYGDHTWKIILHESYRISVRFKSEIVTITIKQMQDTTIKESTVFQHVLDWFRKSGAYFLLFYNERYYSPFPGREWMIENMGEIKEILENPMYIVPFQYIFNVERNSIEIYHGEICTENRWFQLTKENIEEWKAKIVLEREEINHFMKELKGKLDQINFREEISLIKLWKKDQFAWMYQVNPIQYHLNETLSEDFMDSILVKVRMKHYQKNIHKALLQESQKLDPYLFTTRGDFLHSNFYAFGKKRSVRFLEDFTHNTLVVTMEEYEDETVHLFKEQPYKNKISIPFADLEKEEQFLPYVQKMLKGIKGERLKQVVGEDKTFISVLKQTCILLGKGHSHIQSIETSANVSQKEALQDLGEYLKKKFPHFQNTSYSFPPAKQIKTENYTFYFSEKTNTFYIE